MIVIGGMFVGLFTATEAGAVGAVASAAVHFTVTTPLRTLGCDATTGNDGAASCTYKVNTKRDGVGTFVVDAPASKAGYTDGTGTTTFIAQ